MADAEDEIKRLKHELQDTRLSLIYLATSRSPKPYELHKALIGSALSIETRHDLSKWEGKAFVTVMEAAVVDKNGCAFCPLCGDGVEDWSSRKKRGFKYPYGLQMHLDGLGKASQCEVMKMALLYANNANKEKWQTAEKQANISALMKVQQLCEQAGCDCEIREATHVVWLQNKNHTSHSSDIFANGDRYKIKSSPRGWPGTSIIEMSGCSAEEAAHALIW